MPDDLQDIADTVRQIGTLLLGLMERNPGNEEVTEVVHQFNLVGRNIVEAFETLRAEGVIDYINTQELRDLEAAG